MFRRTKFKPLNVLNINILKLLNLEAAKIKKFHSTEVFHEFGVLTVCRFSTLVLALVHTLKHL
jgi:hypothetical protein